MIDIYQKQPKKVIRHKKNAICSQCGHRMRDDIAEAQIQNQRENAPICEACILGVPELTVTDMEMDEATSDRKVEIDRFLAYIRRKKNGN